MKIRSVVLALAMLATPALADGVGPVTALYVPDGVSDNRSCIFFQTNNGSTWYAISKDDWSAVYEFSQANTSFISNQTLSFATSGALCGFLRAYDLVLGTIH